MGVKKGQSYAQWYDTLTLADIHLILVEHYTTELRHLEDMEVDAEIQEELDGRSEKTSNGA